MAVLAWSIGSQQLRPAHLSAASTDPLLDTDHDGVPDNVEWLFMSDPTLADTDGDGMDDFVEIVQHTAVRAHTPPPPIGHKMRVAVSTAIDPATDKRFVWMHCLFQFASGQLDLSWFQPFISFGLVSVPIEELVGRTPISLSMRSDPTRGSLVILSMRLGTVSDFLHLGPGTVNVRASIGSHFIQSSAYLFKMNGALCTLVAQGLESGSDKLLVQTLEPNDGSKSVGFTSNRRCEQTLAQSGMTPIGPVYEVISSNCEISEGMRCGTTCPDQVGVEAVLPNGLVRCAHVISPLLPTPG